jgi:hypothetical protein
MRLTHKTSKNAFCISSVPPSTSLQTPLMLAAMLLPLTHLRHPPMLGGDSTLSQLPGHVPKMPSK